MTERTPIQISENRVLCPECGGDIIVGIAIKPELEYGARTLIPIPFLNHKTIEIINVCKCKNCGHSYTEGVE